MKAALVACALLGSALLGPGCSNCPYGNRTNGGACKPRGRPSAHESTGWHTASMRKKVPVARQKAGPRLLQATVTQYGELWAYTGDTDHVVLDVDGKEIEPKEDTSATGDEPFPSENLSAGAMDKA